MGVDPERGSHGRGAREPESSPVDGRGRWRSDRSHLVDRRAGGGWVPGVVLGGEGGARQSREVARRRARATEDSRELGGAGLGLLRRWILGPGEERQP